jgi:hypothetical protein
MKFFFLVTLLFAVNPKLFVFTPRQFNQVVENLLKDFKISNGYIGEGIAEIKKIAVFNVERVGDHKLYSIAEFKKKFPGAPKNFKFEENHITMINAESGHTRQFPVSSFLRNMEEGKAKRAAELASSAEKKAGLAANEGLVVEEGLAVRKEHTLPMRKDNWIPFAQTHAPTDKNQIPAVNVFEDHMLTRFPEMFEFYQDLLQNKPIGRGIRKSAAVAVGSAGLAAGGAIGWQIKDNSKQSTR